MKVAKKPISKAIIRSSCKENKSIEGNRPKQTHEAPSKTTARKVRYSEFQLFNNLPEPKKLCFDQYKQQTNVSETFATTK